jgi:hypothetical protein
MLVGRGETPPRIHHLDELCERVAVKDPEFASWADRLAPLEVFSVAARYPAEMPEAAVDWGAALAAVEELVALANRRAGAGSG